ncbi:hypothetical protein DMB66_37960 [Actinoplanes sp. ATCC 53533]|nr:hypothetical protein DMB66_37960 [Actinoplanes sp. ATCC 53533]
MVAANRRLTRAYLDEDRAAVSAADQWLRAVSTPSDELQQRDPGAAERLRDLLPVEDAAMAAADSLIILRDTSMARALTDARRLVAQFAPQQERDGLLAAFDNLGTRDAALPSTESVELLGVSGTHLYAAIHAAIALQLHPGARGPFRVQLEVEIRDGRTLSQGMPIEESASYVSPEQAWKALRAALPDLAAGMDGEDNTGTRIVVTAALQLYLLDHPDPTPKQLSDVVRDRLGRYAAELQSWNRSPRQPRPQHAGLTADQLAARRTAERARRRGGKNSRRPAPPPAPTTPAHRAVRQGPAPDPGGSAPTAPGPVVMRYAGPPLTVWAAAHLIAEALMTRLPRAFVAAPGDDRHAIETAMIAYVITVIANNSGAITPATDTVASPQVFAELPVPAVAGLLHHGLKLTLAVIHRSGHRPALGDPGHGAFITWSRLVDTDGASPSDVVADPQLMQRVDDDIKRLDEHAERAFRAVMFAALHLRPDREDIDVPFSYFGRLINEYLAARR